MRTNINEGIQSAGFRAHNEDGYAGVVKSKVITRIRNNTAGAYELGIIAKQLNFFTFKLLRVQCIPQHRCA